mmetsp:Transcript_51659/g.137171  ORF Transcript_51659/g.137171 Transcript_51659/m.137171 type:complete len:280 (-) Transcript_51659:56-895(-)
MVSEFTPRITVPTISYVVPCTQPKSPCTNTRTSLRARRTRRKRRNLKARIPVKFSLTPGRPVDVSSGINHCSSAPLTTITKSIQFHHTTFTGPNRRSTWKYAALTVSSATYHNRKALSSKTWRSSPRAARTSCPKAIPVRFRATMRLQSAPNQSLSTKLRHCGPGGCGVSSLLMRSSSAASSAIASCFFLSSASSSSSTGLRRLSQHFSQNRRHCWASASLDSNSSITLWSSPARSDSSTAEGDRSAASSSSPSLECSMSAYLTGASRLDVILGGHLRI